jgi:predicted  nucleic acid-binding Zn-ribbon protein
MQSQLENINTNMDELQNREQLWSADEIKELIEYTRHLQEENQDLQAKMIMMQAKLSNEEAKVRQMNNAIKQMIYGERN